MSSVSERLARVRYDVQEICPSVCGAINLDTIADAHRIRIVYNSIGFDDNGKEIMGACKVYGLQKLIVVSPSEAAKFRKRFTIAHEMGHIFLRHGTCLCERNDFTSAYQRRSNEAAANMFAAELLLPYQFLQGSLKEMDLSFRMIETIALNYEVSLSATITHLIQVDCGLSLAICHDGTRVDWIVKSPELEYVEITPILDTFFYTSIVQPRKFSSQTADYSDWSPAFSHNFSFREEAKYIPMFQRYLSLVNILEH